MVYSPGSFWAVFHPLQHQASVVCIRQQDYTKTGGYDFGQLDPGNYSYSVRSSSLAGPGNWTEPKYFIVPEPDGMCHMSIVLLSITPYSKRVVL